MEKFIIVGFALKYNFLESEKLILVLYFITYMYFFFFYPYHVAGNFNL